MRRLLEAFGLIALVILTVAGVSRAASGSAERAQLEGKCLAEFELLPVSRTTAEIACGVR